LIRAVGVMLLGTAGWFLYRFGQYVLDSAL